MSNKVVGKQADRPKVKTFDSILKDFPKDRVYNDYIVNDISYYDLVSKYGISKYMFDRLLREYNIKKDRKKAYQRGLKTKYAQYGSKEAYIKHSQEKQLCTIVEKYGSLDTLNAIKSQKSKQMWDGRSAKERAELAKRIATNGGGWNKNTIKSTVQAKYGVSNISEVQEVQSKKMETLKQTSQEKWGCNHPFQVLENRDKASQAILDKYHVRYASQSPIIRVKIRQTNLLKRGAPYGFNLNTVVENNLKKYGYMWNCQRPECRNAVGSKGSHTIPNEQFAKLLDDNNIIYTREFSLQRYVYDFKINNILIEINPSATHNSTWSLFDKTKGIDKYYHFNKSKIANTNGYRCIHVWDWDDCTKVVQLLKHREKVNARDCVVSSVPENIAKDYLNEHHLQGYVKDDIRLGLYYNDEVVEIMTFGKPRYNSKYEYELLRLCGHKYVVGGAEKLFKYFITTYNPTSIVSYCDFSKFSGDVYTALGMSLQKTDVAKHWYCIKTHQHILDSSLNKVGFDNLFGTNYGVGQSNAELMKQNGFVEIYDAGRGRFVWNSSKL